MIASKERNVSCRLALSCVCATHSTVLMHYQKHLVWCAASEMGQTEPQQGLGQGLLLLHCLWRVQMNGAGLTVRPALVASSSKQFSMSMSWR